MRLNVGAHMSIRDGIDRAVQRAQEADCDCLQVFVKANLQWRLRPLPDDEIARFRSRCREHAVSPAIGHASYLLNLASPDDALWHKSIDTLEIELERAMRLGLTDMVIHPGAHAGSGDAAGLERIALAAREVLRRTRGSRVKLCFETTAGAGSVLGGRFEHLARIIRAGRSRRLGVCLDTCHIFSAGYEIRTETTWRATLAEFDRIIGLDRLRVLHLNDSKTGRGSRVDRHEHIGEGRLGLTPFRCIMRDPRLRAVPKILETPKGVKDGRNRDALTLDLLRRLATP